MAGMAWLGHLMLLESLFPLLPSFLMAQEWSASSLPMKMGSCAPAKCPRGASVASLYEPMNLPKVLANEQNPNKAGFSMVFWGVFMF